MVTPAAYPEPTSGFKLMASPVITIPLTSGTFGPNDNFGPAIGGSMGMEYSPAGAGPFGFRLAGGYTSAGLLPVNGVAVGSSLYELSVLAGAGTGIQLFPAVQLRGFVDGGVVFGRLDDGGGVPYGSARAGAGIDYRITDEWSARVDATWTYMFGLYSGFGSSLGIAWAIPAAARRGVRQLEFASVDVRTIFPIFRSYYDESAVGSVRITNTSRKVASDIKVSFIIRQYMDVPKECAFIQKLAPGESVDVPLFGLFNDSILSVTEATKVGAEIVVEYGDGGVQTKAATVLVYDRNALTWTDDRHAAAFVSSKDPWVLDLSGNIAAAVRDVRNPEIPENIQTAIAFHEGLRTYGISYVLSPNRPFATGAADASAVDSLKFPRQTLGYRAGDCADLSVLYASFFEAAGIETAFVTVPGHIFMAFDSGLTRDEAMARGMDERELIFAESKVWVPVETTLRSAGFTQAWQKAAIQWRDAGARGLAGFLSIHEAWKTFPPVGLPADGSTVMLPDSASVKGAFAAELSRMVDAELKTRLALLGAQPATKAARFLNDRGILYARYGRYEDAERDLKAAVKEKYVPASINLGNIAFLRGDYKAAYDRFAEASRQSPDNARLLASMARAAAAMGRTDEVISLLARVRALDPKTADRYASLVEASASATRASRSGTEETIWF